MRIQFIITDYGSFNNFLSDVAVQLSRRGHVVHVICSPDKVIDVKDHFDYAKENITFTYVGFPRGFHLAKHWAASSKIHAATKIFNPDLISIHFTTGIFTSTFRSRFKVKAIGTFHGLGFPVVEGLAKRAIFKFVELFSMGRVDETWVLNRFDYNLIKSEYPKVNVNKLPGKGLGCNLQRFNISNFDQSFRSELRQTLGLKETDFVLCFTGRFVSFKGFDKVVLAFKSLLTEQHVSDIKLILIGGEDPIHDSGLTDSDNQWLKQCSAVVNVGFTAEVEKYLSVVDAFVFPSEKEGMPVCIIEALAMEIPVVTSDSRGCNDLVEHMVNGVIVGKNPTPELIAAEILQLKNNKQLYNDIKSNLADQRAELDRNRFIDQQVRYFESQSDHLVF